MNIHVVRAKLYEFGGGGSSSTWICSFHETAEGASQRLRQYEKLLSFEISEEDFDLILGSICFAEDDWRPEYDDRHDGQFYFTVEKKVLSR